MRTQIIERGNPSQAALYDAAVAQLHNVYASAFGATPQTSPPRFAVTLSPQGEIVCIAGIRMQHEGFLSQCYLDEPIETLLSRTSGYTIAPQDVLEVGALATLSPFPVFQTLRAISHWGRARHISWAVFTGTAEVRRLIARAKITALVLSQAKRERVADPQAWGSYYQHDPWVCAFQDPQTAAKAALPQAGIA